MGYTTDFVGWVQIDPPCNEQETEYLRAFNRTRRWDRPAGPYFVLDHPLDEEEVGVSTHGEAFNRPGPGEPSLWCPWTVGGAGGFLCFDGVEKAYAADRWLGYLIDTFLAPSATAARSGDPSFVSFTFDHVCDGAVAACRRDTGELSVIFATDNVVDGRVLLPGVPLGVVWGGLPYEPERDRFRQGSVIRRAAHDARFGRRAAV
ncbi:hypothetical protein BH20ACT5_BH20ACT5_20370 [soil metagenome]